MKMIVLHKTAYTTSGRAGYNEDILINSNNIKIVEHYTVGEEKSRVIFIDGTDVLVIENPREILDMINNI